MGRRRAVAAVVFGVTVTGALAVVAARADNEVPGASLWLTGVDVAVGLAFVGAAAWAPGSLWERGLVAAVGAAWLVGSVVPSARLLHQAVLVVALVAFPTGRLSGFARWLLVGLAIPVGLLLVPQLPVALLFAAVAVSALARLRADPVAAWYPTVASVCVAAVVAASWSVAHLDPRVFDPTVALLAYQAALVLVAFGFVVASRAMIAARAQLADLFLGDEGLTGLDGLAAVLGGALGDPQLRVYRWEGPETGYGDGHGAQVVGERGTRRWLYVDDGTTRLAAVEHDSSMLDDTPTAAAVSTAVRLAVSHLQLQVELQVQLDDLEAARMRIVAAVDRQRAVTAARLQDDVVVPLQTATAVLAGVESPLENEEAAYALSVAAQELAAAAADVVAVVSGVPPARLGGGRLRGALEALAQRSPVPVTVIASADGAADSASETAMFYVCSEALVNAVKHASATKIVVHVDGDGDVVRVTISDDGCGGADVYGSGLQGLADRLATRRGRLQVDSPPGAGTTVTATIPVRRSFATAPR